MTAAIVSLGPRTSALARRLRTSLPDAAVHGPEGLPDADVRFEDAVVHLRALFAAGTPIVGLCATGILVRSLAPLLQAKRDEPPVIAVSADGSAVVPVLGGHRGANGLARQIARALGVTAAITTASDATFGVALDEPPPGWRLVDASGAKIAAARLLDGGGARVLADDGLEAGWPPLPVGDEVEIRLSVRTGAAGDLVYRPRALALGVGTERGVAPAVLVAHAREVLDGAGLADDAVAAVVSVDLKAAEPAIHALAAELGAPARFFPAEALLRETSRLSTRSEAVYRETGAYGVAEAAALAAVGPEGRLVVPKVVGPRVTCAVAIATGPIDVAASGRPRGSLTLVGLGPGSSPWRTAEAEAALEAADELVGYGLYLDLAAARGKPHRAFPLGEEVERCRYALDRAAEGRRVALVCSGDPGVYALASLVLELLDREPTPGRERVALTICPGLSAMFAAAARAGAPLGHDFCAISLSTLLTPWSVIEARLRGAATGDFVTALYNPVSNRRREELGLARDLLLEHRAPGTPVLVSRNLGRDGETTRLTELAALTAEDLDMLSLVIVGSRATRRVPRLHGPDWVYTPRGYPIP